MRNFLRGNFSDILGDMDELENKEDNAL